jgi:hypothetical protein
MSPNDDRNVDPVEEMTLVAQNFLDLPRWGFKESYRSLKPGRLIFDSEWCRISLIWGGWDPLGGNNIDIRYGRLHAPSDAAVMVWNGMDCRCWHRVEYALHFLDGRTPTEAARLNYSHPITAPFYQKEVRERFHRRQPEWLAQMEVAIWEHYGKRVFEIFDLRQPDLWERYSQFLKEAYDIKGRNPAIKPPLDKVC